MAVRMTDDEWALFRRQLIAALKGCGWTLDDDNNIVREKFITIGANKNKKFKHRYISYKKGENNT